MVQRFLSTCLLVTWVGCGQAPTSSSAPSAAKPEGTDNTGESTVGETSADPTTSAEADAAARTAATLQELTQAVRKYSVEQRRTPKTLEELVTHGYLNQLPDPPAGRQFAISKNLQVVLTGP